MRVAWVTDIHLNFVDDEGIEQFCRQILATDCDALLVGGDIGEAPSVARYLDGLVRRLERPVYFVLGNHDYYRGSIQNIRQWAITVTKQSPWLRWLPAASVVALTTRTALVGQDGWSDGRLGDFLGSPVRLNDYLLIEELRGLEKPALLAKLNALGDEAGDYLRTTLREALVRFDKTIVLTHVPPFRESCLYRGKPGDPNWLPHFTCKAVGDVLETLMEKYPERQTRVLCGHSHGAAEIEVLSNLRVTTGPAEYGRPAVSALLEVD
jgi:Icc-related predicted phosphoesterase